jgi:hypothetical protein
MTVYKSFKATMIAAAVFALAAGSAAAAANATLSLAGTVAPVLAISVVPEAFAAALPVGSTVTDQKLATVTEISNNPAGYSVSLASANGGALRGSLAGNADAVPYTLKYGNQAVVFSLGLATIADASARTGGAGSAKDLAISFAAAFLNADTYSDTLTFTITAK